MVRSLGTRNISGRSKASGQARRKRAARCRSHLRKVISARGEDPRPLPGKGRSPGWLACMMIRLLVIISTLSRSSVQAASTISNPCVRPPNDMCTMNWPPWHIRNFEGNGVPLRNFSLCTQGYTSNLDAQNQVGQPTQKQQRDESQGSEQFNTFDEDMRRDTCGKDRYKQWLTRDVRYQAILRYLRAALK